MLTPSEHFVKFPDSWQVPVYSPGYSEALRKGATRTVYKALVSRLFNNKKISNK